MTVPLHNARPTVLGMSRQPGNGTTKEGRERIRVRAFGLAGKHCERNGPFCARYPQVQFGTRRSTHSIPPFIQEPVDLLGLDAVPKYDGCASSEDSILSLLPFRLKRPPYGSKESSRAWRPRRLVPGPPTQMTEQG
ncbi:hypothetical protein NW765_017778 [Fusarium oxysporum]|nr:hypothetical protein NW765_017778 [Fusarium oxysporum]